jgi:hypothetical protein
MELLLLNDLDITENTPLGGNIDVDKFRFCIADAQLSKLEKYWKLCMKGLSLTIKQTL